MGGADPYDVKDPIGVQIFDATKYAFGNIFRIYNSMLGASDGSASRRQTKRELAEGLNAVEKVMLGYYTGYSKFGIIPQPAFGYTYTRNERRRRLCFAISALDNTVADQKRKLRQLYKDKPETLRTELVDLAKLQRQRKLKLKRIFLGDK